MEIDLNEVLSHPTADSLPGAFGVSKERANELRAAMSLALRESDTNPNSKRITDVVLEMNKSIDGRPRNLGELGLIMWTLGAARAPLLMPSNPMADLAKMIGNLGGSKGGDSSPSIPDDDSPIRF